MCRALSTKEVASTGNPAETTNFRKLLLRSCQKEFEKVGAGLVDVENKKKEIERAETVRRTVFKNTEIVNQALFLFFKNRILRIIFVIHRNSCIFCC
jgi:hypothetical protein